MSNVVTPEFRVSFPNVFKPKRNELSGKDEFSVVALFAKNADMTELKKACQDAVEKKWGADKTKWPKNIRLPFRDQGERIEDAKSKGKAAPAGHEVGAVFINLKSSQRPGVVDESVQPILDETQFYAGCFARASLNAYAYDQAGNRGVTFELQHIQKLRDGEALGGRVRVEDAFTPVQGSGPAGSASDLFG